jgi:hypothetical protein
MDEDAARNEEIGGEEDTAGDEDAAIQARDAAVILAEARARAQHELSFSDPVLLVTWGLVWLIAYGSIWVSVRGQQPYIGPPSGVLLVLFLLLAGALSVTAAVMNRAVSGVGGLSAVRRRSHYLALVIGYTGVLVMEGGLAHSGASRPVYDVFGAAAPVLVTGAIYIASSAATQDWGVFGLGAWLVIVAAASSYAGPWSVWAVDGLAGGIAFLLLAVIKRGQRS